MKKLLIVFLGFIFVFFCIFIYLHYPVETILDTPYLPEDTINSQIIQNSKANPSGQWVWQYSTNSNGQNINPQNSNKFILTLTPDGRLTSTTDCNTFSGSYIINETSMTVGPLVGTKKFCDDSIETQYINGLTLVSGYAFSKDDMLVLYLLRNSGVMVFSHR